MTLGRDRADNLEKHRVELGEKLSLTADVWARLVQYGVLTRPLRDEIQVCRLRSLEIEYFMECSLQSLRTPAAQNDRLIDELLKLDDDRYDQFVRALRETGQQHIANAYLRVEEDQGAAANYQGHYF